MARYQAKGDQTLTTTLTTALTVGSNATTAQRNEIYEFILGVALTPSDSTISFTVQRVSALGTATAVTPGDTQGGADRAAQAAVGKNHTVEPTVVANAFILDAMPLNARATFRWVAPPDGNIIHAATVGAGYLFGALHASRTEDVNVQAFWRE